ncbi:integrase [Paractinoplanes rishiriensis]|uniref:Uncharacterized protein n=1 Tax=Paractinoplanes rishiriensis TaxID=1050105 RepID=A0A919K2C3_9ACTN|nr:integrase [Actinoplanes rishiriensis]GIE97587.1 hypothetical protein Ari01nite_50520 [Actinoplanes rishiriensis]
MRLRLRHVRVDDHTYLWTAQIRCIQGSGDCHRGIRVRVWRDGKTSRALQADLLSLAWPAPLGACATDGSYPTADDVRQLVDYALAHGWLPAARGGTHALSETGDAAFRLPGFLLTDRLTTPSAPDPTERVIRASGA